MSSSSGDGRDSPMFVRPKARQRTGEDGEGTASGSASAAPGGEEQRQAAATNEPLEAGSRQIKEEDGQSSDEPSPILSPRSLTARRTTVPTRIDEIYPEITEAPVEPRSNSARLSVDCALDRELQLLSSMTSKGIVTGGNASLPTRGRTASLVAGTTTFIRNKIRSSASMSDVYVINRSSSIPSIPSHSRSVRAPSSSMIIYEYTKRFPNESTRLTIHPSHQSHRVSDGSFPVH